jgi:hypothetical protein
MLSATVLHADRRPPASSKIAFDDATLFPDWDCDPGAALALPSINSRQSSVALQGLPLQATNYTGEWGSRRRALSPPILRRSMRTKYQSQERLRRDNRIATLSCRAFMFYHEGCEDGLRRRFQPQDRESEAPTPTRLGFINAVYPSQLDF